MQPRQSLQRRPHSDLTLRQLRLRNIVAGKLIGLLLQPPEETEEESLSVPLGRHDNTRHHNTLVAGQCEPMQAVVACARFGLLWGGAACRAKAGDALLHIAPQRQRRRQRHLRHVRADAVVRGALLTGIPAHNHALAAHCHRTPAPSPAPTLRG